jgi:hypothetical protein
MTRSGAKREQHLGGVLDSTAGLYGDLQGIAGPLCSRFELGYAMIDERGGGVALPAVHISNGMELKLIAFPLFLDSSYSSTMTREPPTMLFRERNWGAPAQFGTRSVTEPRREFWRSLVIEGHERAIKSSVP